MDRKTALPLALLVSISSSSCLSAPAGPLGYQRRIEDLLQPSNAHRLISHLTRADIDVLPQIDVEQLELVQGGELNQEELERFERAFESVSGELFEGLQTLYDGYAHNFTLRSDTFPYQFDSANSLRSERGDLQIFAEWPLRNDSLENLFSNIGRTQVTFPYEGQEYRFHLLFLEPYSSHPELPGHATLLWLGYELEDGQKPQIGFLREYALEGEHGLRSQDPRWVSNTTLVPSWSHQCNSDSAGEVVEIYDAFEGTGTTGQSYPTCMVTRPFEPMMAEMPHVASAIDSFVEYQEFLHFSERSTSE